MDLPRRFGRYTLIERIANGGVAEIYKARLDADDGFSKTVAIKRLLPSWCTSDELAGMLKDEARVLCLLPCQSIVQVQELGTEEGSPYIAMEFVHGIDCAKLINRLIRDRVPMPLRHALYIIEQVLTALDCAHRCEDADGKPLGLVHRDVSPSNILISWNGEVKVTDFGIAKGMHRTERTDAGQIRGKYSYMSPEQARGEAIDARTDVFAAGIVFFEMLAAQRLFACKCEYDTLQRVAHAEIDISGIDSLPPEIRAMAMLALAPDPAKRFQSAADMLSYARKAAKALSEIGSSLDLAQYLKEVFPEEIAREQSGLHFRQAGEPTRRMAALYNCAGSKFARIAGYAWRFAAMVALLVATSAFAPIPKGSESRPALQPSSIKETAVERQSLPMQGPALKGMIAIDSVPSGAKGTLVLGKSSKRIVTPFTQADIDLEDAIQGEVRFEAAGFDPVVEKFSIGPESAAFVRSFEFKKRAQARLSVGARPWGIVTVPGIANRREAPLVAQDVRPGSYQLEVIFPPTGRVLRKTVEINSGASRVCLAKFGESEGLSCR